MFKAYYHYNIHQYKVHLRGSATISIERPSPEIPAAITESHRLKLFVFANRLPRIRQIISHV